MVRTLALFLASALPAFAQQASDTLAPEAPTAPAAFGSLSPAAAAAMETRDSGRPVEAEDWMVVAANPLAVEAGAEILRSGGSAADAMVAVQTVLGLVEPQSSGLGGGAFLVWFDAATGAVTTLDARETAPRAATPGSSRRPRASRWNSSTRWWAAGPWAPPARRFCSRRRTGAGAGPAGPTSSIRPSVWPRRALRSRRVSRGSWPRIPRGSRAFPPPPPISCPRASR